MIDDGRRFGDIRPHVLALRKMLLGWHLLVHMRRCTILMPDDRMWHGSGNVGDASSGARQFCVSSVPDQPRPRRPYAHGHRSRLV